MFDVGEWNDDLEAQTLSEHLQSTRKEDSAQQEKGASSRRKRLKRNRLLMEVLRTLKSSSVQNPELPPLPDLQPPAPPPGKRRAAELIADESPPTESPHPNTEKHLNRRQWKNKMKNKKRNRNKFKTSPEKPKHESPKDEDARNDGGEKDGNEPQSKETRGHRDNSKRSGPEGGSHKPLKRRLCEEEMDPGGQKVQRKEKRTADSRVSPQERARLQKLKKLLQREGTLSTNLTSAAEEPEETAANQESSPLEVQAIDRSSSLRSRMEQKLSSARFRYINEQLYTTDSQEAVHLFQSDPEAFNIYHTGFSQQVQRWPVNPITDIIKYIKNRPASLVVADFGCGDAQLARSVRNTVHSFDLVALNNRVTVCDMAEVPLADAAVDIAVFCLSLMGRNLSDFLQEANRVLKPEGVLLIAEVSSRFDDIRQFLSAMSHLGFKNVSKNTENSHFYMFEFSKAGSARDASKHPGLQLRPCLYKKR